MADLKELNEVDNLILLTSLIVGPRDSSLTKEIRKNNPE